jgi:choline dehydrogenase-like flavoprotein
VGRHLQGHLYAGAIGVFPDAVQDCLGPGPSCAVTSYRHHNPGIIGGGILVDEFVPTPLEARGNLVESGIISSWGIDAKRGMRDLYSTTLSVVGPIQELPMAESRVQLTGGARDSLGMPVARLDGGVHASDLRTARWLSERASDWLRASGATTTKPVIRVPKTGPSAGTHQAGTARMGKDPQTSVTDKWGLIWGHDRIFVVDSSLFATNGGVNPVLTIMANSRRISAKLAAELGA